MASSLGQHPQQFMQFFVRGFCQDLILTDFASMSWGGFFSVLAQVVFVVHARLKAGGAVEAPPVPENVEAVKGYSLASAQEARTFTLTKVRFERGPHSAPSGLATGEGG